MELTINQLIKLIIAIVVIVVVIFGIYYVFKNNVSDFIKNIGPNANPTGKFILSLI